MNVPNFNAKECERIRRRLDDYLSNELLVETTGEVLHHLENCEACARELAARTRLRDALRRAALGVVPREELRPSVERRLRALQPGWRLGSPAFRLVAALAAVAIMVLGGVATHQWIGARRGRHMVERVLALGVSDHVVCALKGHNYPDVAPSPEVLRQKLGPQYAGLLAVVQQKLPGFEVLEAHRCSLPGNPRKYVHFITRGRGSILSVILTRSEGEQLPTARAVTAQAPGGVDLYEAHLDGMNATGFPAQEYWGFVVSDLSPTAMRQIAGELAPSLREALAARAALSSLPKEHLPAI